MHKHLLLGVRGIKRSAQDQIVNKVAEGRTISPAWNVRTEFLFPSKVVLFSLSEGLELVVGSKH